MQIDCYGFEATSQFYKKKELITHLVKRIDNVLYYCFTDKDPRAIHRLDHDGNGDLRLMWSYGNWCDANTLSYVPINETIDKTKED